jgi:ligand-binding SRPBCC domain-containing protein
MTTTFVARVLIDAPVAEVFAFHERPDALALLTPAFPPVRVVQQSGGIAAGARVVLRVGRVIPWVALHTAYEKDRLFVDEQVRGPFARWVHRHEFDDIGGRTRLTDRVTFELPGGSLLNRLAAPLVRLGLTRMFAHRHAATRRMCEAR